MTFGVPEDLVSGPDIEEVRRALSILISPGQTFELRGLPAGRSWIGKDIDAAVAETPSLATGTGLYYTVNPLRHNLKKAAGNNDVLERFWLYVDVDSVRPADTNATDKERTEAMKLADLINLDLKSRGCPEPVAIDSGNGIHLLYRVSLPNDALSSIWMQSILKKLAELYNTAEAKIDLCVHNAGRIARLPGTWNRKYPTTEGRPHRMARLASVPAEIKVAGIDVLRQIAGVGTPDPAATPKIAPWTVPPIRTSGDPTAWFRKAIEHEAGKVAMTPAGERHNSLRASARTLGGYLHHAFISESEIRVALKLAGERAGLGQKDIADTINWGVENGKANPLPWPTKLTSVQAGAPVSGDDEAEQTTGHSGRIYRFPLIVKGSTVQAEPVDWLYEEYIPRGFLTLFVGQTSVGKTFVALDLIARMSRGGLKPLSDSECFPLTSTLFISEDPVKVVLVPRLIIAGADMDNINFMSWQAMAEFTLSDEEMLDDTWESAGSPGIVVIDPPTNFLGAKDEHKNAEVRGILMHVAGWAERHNVACILITHTNKGSKKDMAALDRIIGSVAWATTSRIAHMFGPHPEKDDQYLFAQIKSNIGEKTKGIAYEILRIAADDPTNKLKWKLARVKFLEHYDGSADDMLSGKKKKARGVVAVEWLAERFRIQREWPSEDLKRDANEAGLSRNALFAPEVMALPIRKRQIVTAAGDRHWVWVAEEGWPPPPEMNRDCGIVGL